jgi:hypothetical protein
MSTVTETATITETAKAFFEACGAGKAAAPIAIRTRASRRRPNRSRTCARCRSTPSE